MENNKKDSFFRFAGILGLLFLLIIFVWIRNRSDHSENDSGGGKHDHSDPSQHGDIKGGKLSKDDSDLTPSGKIIDGERVVEYEAYQYAFSPDPLIVKAGETVVLHLKSRDVEHGIMIPEIDFNSNMPANRAKKMKFKAPTTSGRYPIFCSVYCGSDHGNMKGTLVVLPKNDKEESHDH